ncbi:unnamed protein product [Phytophthora lilii]|uniref:Unnamed protein product n=1 Tax=Phytophthora lilii TaxID=2077276 RepID=A0A9W6U3B5_9STRA|nr:unnamed protein product [Phytophthora lilii]
MCVILCVDSLQKLQHESGSNSSDFYTVLCSLIDHINDSQVLDDCDLLNDYFPAISDDFGTMGTDGPDDTIEATKINGRDVFAEFNDGNNGSLIQLLIDDMGGHGRALDLLFNVMLQRQAKDFRFLPVMHSVLAAIRQAYPKIVDQIGNMRHAFLAVITRQCVDIHSRFGTLTLDQVISFGLIRRDGRRIQCPFILYYTCCSKLMIFRGMNLLHLLRSDSKILSLGSFKNSSTVSSER